MSSVDYTLSESSLRRVLLKLSKTKLIKECKATNVTFGGSKQDVIQRLLDKTKKSRKSKKNHKPQQQKTSLKSIRFNSADLMRKKGEKLINELNRMTQVLLYNPHRFDNDFMNDSSHRAILKHLKDLLLNKKKKSEIRVAAFYCFDTMMRLYYITDRNKNEYNKVSKKYKYDNICKNFSTWTIKGFNVPQIIQHNFDFNQWVKTLKIGDKIDILPTDIDGFGYCYSAWNIYEIHEMNEDQKENKILIKYRQKKNAPVYEQKIDLNPKIGIVNRKILPLNTKTMNKNLYREKLGQNILRKTKCFCLQCLFIIDKNEIKSHLQSNITFNFAENLMDIIAEFAVGFVVLCCNERTQCDNEIFLHDEEPWNNDNIIYYKEAAAGKLKYNKQFKIRIFCELCTTILRDCKSCSQREILNEDGVCGLHLKCNVCSNYSKHYPNVIETERMCAVCKKDCCLSCLENVEMKNNKKIVKCKSCITSDEAKELQKIIAGCLGFDEFISNVIAKYSVGVSIECCNEECKNDINFRSLYDYKNDFEAGGYMYRTTKKVKHKRRTFTDSRKRWIEQYHYDMHRNKLYCYSLKLEKDEKWEEFMSKLKQSQCKTHSYINGDPMRIFCHQCSHKLSRCNGSFTETPRSKSICEYKDSDERCIMHRLGYHSGWEEKGY